MVSADKIYEEILEWDRTKKGLKGIEEALYDLAPRGGASSHQMVVNATLARALRLIMESLEVKT